MSPFLAPGMYADWAVEPLSVAYRPSPLHRRVTAADPPLRVSCFLAPPFAKPPPLASVF